MIETVYTVITDTTMGSPGWSKHEAGETILNLDGLIVDKYLFRSRRWPSSLLCRSIVIMIDDELFCVSGFVWTGTWYYTWI